jgi:hypothetical protein
MPAVVPCQRLVKIFPRSTGIEGKSVVGPFGPISNHPFPHAIDELRSRVIELGLCAPNFRLARSQKPSDVVRIEQWPKGFSRGLNPSRIFIEFPCSLRAAPSLAGRTGKVVTGPNDDTDVDRVLAQSLCVCLDVWHEVLAPRGTICENMNGGSGGEVESKLLRQQP